MSQTYSNYIKKSLWQGDITPAGIKNDVINRVGEKYGKLDVINAVDRVDDELIKKYITEAKNTIQTNIDSGRMSREEYENTDYEKKIIDKLIDKNTKHKELCKENR